MHMAHCARKSDLSGYKSEADGTLESRSGSSNVLTRLQKMTPAIIAVCLLGAVVLSSQQSSIASKDELSLLQTMAATDENAQLQLGLAYRDGRLGLKADPVQAGYWLQRAATNGNSYAKQLLGNKAQSTTQVSVGGELSRLSLAPSIEHLKSQAASGDSRAQFELAMRYRDGSWGVERNPALFREWLEKSAAGGNEIARQELNTIATGN